MSTCGWRGGVGRCACGWRGGVGTYMSTILVYLQCPPEVCVEDASVAYVAALLCDVLPARTEQIQLD